MPRAIIGYDGSGGARDALTLGSMLAQAARWPIEVVCAYASDPSTEGTRFGVADLRTAREQAEARTAEGYDALGDVDTVLCRAVAATSPAEGLHHQVEHEQTSLLVIGSSRWARSGRVTPGSTGERLLGGAPCPVAMAPRGLADRDRRTLRRVGVAYEGSREAHAALLAARWIADGERAELEVIGVFELNRYDAELEHRHPHLPAHLATSRAYFMAHLHAAAGGAEATIRTGDPAHEIVAATYHLDLLVLGSRRYGPAPAVLLGATSARVMRAAACPVLVVPRGREDREADVASR
jgi:nucleotide-binding universal stress UspA family protein